MSDANGRLAAGGARGPALFDPAERPELYEGVLAKRVVAFFIDAIVVFLLMIPAALIVAFLGIVTLGIGWLLFAPLFAIVALGYVALTLGGPNAATVGMRTLGIEMRTLDGGRPYPLLAAVHALIFWLSVSILTPLILIVGLVTERSRLLHDLILNTVLLNSAHLRPGE
jgi:uncharacterized RDD family membrane protein YckC